MNRKTKELINAEKEQEETHKQNIENILITIGIISFLILFLLLCGSIIVNEKWIRLLGVVGFLFEFINLLPRLEKLTHHSPVYMPLIMVGIAALLVPFHHRTEKWVTSKIVEKINRYELLRLEKSLSNWEENLIFCNMFSLKYPLYTKTDLQENACYQLFS